MPIYVTDTHPLLWFSTETYSKLSPDVLRVFRKAARGEVLIWVPAMALWEAGMLARMRRVVFKTSFKQWADTLVAQPCFALAPMDLDVVDSALSVQLNADVFDMAIVATARAKDVPLITKDTLIVESKTVEVFW